MKGNIVELKYWQPEWAVTAYAWKESGDYSAFFRTLPGEYTRENFINLPQLMGSLVWGIFADGLLDEATKLPRLIGLVTAYEWDPNSRVASAGLMIDKDVQSMGIGTDAFITILRYLFETKNLRKVCLEFSASDEKLIHLMNKMGALVDASVKIEGAIEANPFFEGRRKKQVFLNGRYYDFLMCACFKNQFDRMMEAYAGKKKVTT